MLELSLPLEKNNEDKYRSDPLNPVRLKQLAYFEREHLDFNRFYKLPLVMESMWRPKLSAGF